MKTILKILALATALLTSCQSSKDFVCLQDMYSGNRFPIDRPHEAVIHPDDRLRIIVSCKQSELAAPFNSLSGTVRLNAAGEISAAASQSSPAAEEGYRVDKEGNIIFPIFGRLHVEGLTLHALRDTIASLIVEGNYIKEPLVTAELLNFRYTVMGAVARNGTFPVDGDRITLLEALAQAGGLSANARFNSVAVVREVDGERRMYVHDLRDHTLFSSPCYYLQQNDIVYVQPKYLKKDLGDRAWQYGTGILSLITAVSSVIWVTK